MDSGSESQGKDREVHLELILLGGKLAVCRAPSPATPYNPAMPANDSTFREEVTDLRAEIMLTGVLAPMLILSWVAACVVSFSSLRVPD